MNDFTRLQAKLAKLRQRERAPGEKRIIRGEPEHLLAAITSEIDETILPRDVGFTSEAGATFYLAIANRRLQSLVSISPKVDGAADLAGAPIADAEDENLVRIKTLLLKVLSTDKAWAISSRRQSGNGFASDVGVPAEPLMRAWNVTQSPLGQADPDSVLEEYLGTLGARASAWLLIEGEEVKGQFGTKNNVAALSDKAAIFLDSYFSKKEALFQGEEGPNGLVYSSGSDGPAVFFVDCKASMAFVLTDASQAPTLARDWQARVVL